MVAFISAASAAAPDIVASTNIPFGNAANLRVVREGSASAVRFTPHPHGGPESLWFCFRIRSSGSSAPIGAIRVVLENSENLLGSQRPDRFRPVFRLTGGDWERAGAPEIIRLPDGRQEVAWTLDASKSELDFAFSYPYGQEEIAKLLRETGDCWKQDTIGVSQGGRPLLRLSNDYGRPKGARPGVYLMARQHSAEVSGSWVLDGVLRRLAEAGDRAPLAWVVPLANADGVEQGDYGKDNFPYDLNRAWGNPPMRHETLVIQRDMRRWLQRCRPMAGMDFHSPGASESQGIFTFLSTSEKNPETARNAESWALDLAESLGKAFAAEKFNRAGNYKSRWETPRFVNFCQEDLGVTGITLEIPYAIIHDTVMTRENYQDAGRRIADVIITRAQNPGTTASP